MTCNNVTTVQDYLEGDDPQTVIFGCMPSGSGKPTHVPNPDEIPFYFDQVEEKLYYYTCEPDMWVKVDSTLLDLNPVDIGNLANPTENLQVPVVYEIGGTKVEGLVSLGELVEAIQNATNPVISVEKDEEGNLVVTTKDGNKEEIELDYPTDLKGDGKGNLTFTNPDGSKETINVVDPEKFGRITDVDVEGGEIIITQGSQKFRASLDDQGSITEVKREGDVLAITEGDKTFRVSLANISDAADRPINFAPSSNNDSLEITLADGSKLDVTRQELADWLSNKDSSVATDEELQGLADQVSSGDGDLQDQIDALNDRLSEINPDLDQAQLSIDNTHLILTNEDGTNSKISLTNLVKLSAATDNAAQIREDGIYVPTVEGGTGVGEISTAPGNIITEKNGGLFAPVTSVTGNDSITVTGTGTDDDPYVISGGDITEGYLPKDPGVSCDPAIQMTTAVKVATEIATWANPATVTSTQGSTYSHSITAHGEYESEDSVQWIASLKVVSPKQINFTVFHPELNYRAKYYDGHVYLDVGLVNGQTFNGNKEITFDITEGECDDNVVGWENGEKIFASEIESPKFGEGDDPNDKDDGTEFIDGYDVHLGTDLLQVDFYNKSGEPKSFRIAKGSILKPHGYRGGVYDWYFANTDSREVYDAVKVESRRGRYRLDPEYVDFTKDVTFTYLDDISVRMFVSMKSDDSIVTNAFNYTPDAWKEQGVSSNYPKIYIDMLTSDKTIVTNMGGDNENVFKLNIPSDLMGGVLENGIELDPNKPGRFNGYDGRYDARNMILTHQFTEFPHQWFPQYPYTFEQAMKELDAMGIPYSV